MRRPFGSRTLLIVFGALVMLLTALGVVQYRWSTRVAAADTQREREHLDSAAALFGNEFDGVIANAIQYIQENARPLLQSNARLTGIPKLFGEIYYIDKPVSGVLKAKRLAADGRLEPSTAPDWMAKQGCAALMTQEPPALVVSAFDVTTSESRNEAGFRIFRTFGSRPEQCFVGVIDLRYLRETLFPSLIRQSFGEATARQYDFGVVSQIKPHAVLYGRPMRADLRKPFFSISPLPPAIRKLPPPGADVPTAKSVFYIGRVQTAVVFKGRQQLPDLFGPGIWELNIAHRGLPLNDAFEHTRWRDLFISLAVELLLVAGVVFLLVTARRMQQLADQKIRFVAGVSHELRTPVSAIVMLSRNQADGLVTGADRVKQYGELMHQQGRRLSEMVEQTLQYAGIQSGLRRPSKQEIDLRGLIEEVLDAHRDELTRSGFVVETALSPHLPPIVGDPQLLRTALDNLLSNAQKYAGSGGWVCIRADYLASDKEVQISVQDRGAGIDSEDRDEIFEPFYRAKSVIEAQIPGSGLGLSLVRSAADAHGGNVTVESTPGRGSKFTLHLPL